jgi:hypothetical protein
MLQPAERFARLGMGEKATPGGKQPPNRRENRFQPYLSGRHSHPLGRFASQKVTVEEKTLSRFSKQPSYRGNGFIAPSLRPFGVQQGLYGCVMGWVHQIEVKEDFINMPNCGTVDRDTPF